MATNPALKKALGIALILLTAASMYMSWGALYEFAIACGMPAARAVVFPQVIDIVVVVAMLIALQNNSTNKWERLYPWAALAIFGAFTILGNAMKVFSTPPELIHVPVWVAVATNAMPAIALLVTVHLAAVNVYKKQVSPENVLTVDKVLAKPLVLALALEGKTVREIEKVTGIARSTVDRWVKADVAESAAA
jgi:hypothetical protein